MPDISKILKEINRHTTGSQKVVYGPWFDTYHNLYHIHQFLKDNGSGENNIKAQYADMRDIVQKWMTVEPDDLMQLKENQKPYNLKYERWTNDKYIVTMLMTEDRDGIYDFDCQIEEIDTENKN